VSVPVQWAADAGLGPQEFGVEAARVERGAQDRGVGGTGPDRGGGTAGMTEHDVHLRDQRIGGAPLHDPLEQAGARARLDRDGEAAGLGALAAGALGRRTDRLDRDPALVEQDRAGRGQRDPAAGPLQERHAELALQLADGRRERRLGHPQPHRGPGEVQLLGDNYESSNQLQIYDFTCGYILLPRMIHRRISPSSRLTHPHQALTCENRRSAKTPPRQRSERIRIHFRTSVRVDMPSSRVGAAQRRLAAQWKSMTKRYRIRPPRDQGCVRARTQQPLAQ
jgi:hypothetical protein